MAEKRILLVDDEATTRAILAYLLREEGYDAETVVGAAAAAKRLQSDSYTIVVTDLLLPDGSGTDVADTAVELGMKALIISGALAHLPDGANERHELLTKDLGPSEIVAAVRQVIGGPAENG